MTVPVVIIVRLSVAIVETARIVVVSSVENGIDSLENIVDDKEVYHRAVCQTELTCGSSSVAMPVVSSFRYPMPGEM